MASHKRYSLDLPAIPQDALAKDESAQLHFIEIDAGGLTTSTQAGPLFVANATALHAPSVRPVGPSFGALHPYVRFAALAGRFGPGRLAQRFRLPADGGWRSIGLALHAE